MQTNKHLFKTNNYKDLVQFSEACYFAKRDHIYSIDVDSVKFVISEFDKKMQKKTTILEYTYEYPTISKFFLELFDIQDQSQSYTTKIFVNSDNYYQFLMNSNMLDLILTNESLVAQGIPASHSFKLKCKNGKVRDITAPADEIKPILQKINTTLQYTYDKRNSNFQVAYKKGKSIKDNALPHKDNEYVFKIDLHNFFPSCKRNYVENYTKFLFKNTINSTYVMNKWLDIILVDDALYIGNPVSGTLANVIISNPVKYIKNICDKFNITFTVYADDMTFSSNKFIAKDFIIDIFTRAFTRYDMENDFSLSVNKCFGLSNSHRFVTGVVLNHNNQVTCHRPIYDSIRMTLHQLSYGDESHYNYNHLKGQIAFMSMLDESGKLKKLIEKYKYIVLEYNLMSSENLAKLGL